MAELNLSPHEWIGYASCNKQEAVELFWKKYGIKDVEVIVTVGAILVRPKKERNENLKSR